MLDIRPFDFLVVQNKFDKVLQSLFWKVDNIFIPNNMDGYFTGTHPIVMEIFPDADFLLHPLLPVFWEFLVVGVGNAPVVGACTHHVKKRRHAVEWVSDQQQNPLSVKLGFAITLWVMRFDDPDPLVDESFSSKAHEHEIFVKLFEDVTIASRGQPHYFFEVSSQESVAGAWVRGHDHCVLVLSLFL